MSESQPSYLIITVGTAGDVHPFLRLAGGLRAMGRAVTVLTNTCHEDLVRGARFAFVGLGARDDLHRVLANPDVWHPRKGFAVLLADYRRQLEEVVAGVRASPGGTPRIALTHALAVPGAAIARELGLLQSVVAVYLAPSNLRSCYDPLTVGPVTVRRWVPRWWRRAFWRFVERAWVDPVPVAQINAARAPLGLPSVRSLLTHIAEAPDLSLALFPPWFASVQPDWPQPFVSGDFLPYEPPAGARLPPELAAFLAAGERPLVFTAGTGNLHVRRFLACARDAAAALGQRAVFVCHERSQLPDELPASVLWQPHVVPLQDLLTRAAALVHHGGIGTVAEALRAGVPQLITPFAWDQFDNGARVAALGAGAVLPAANLSAGRLARRLRALLASEAVRHRCALVAARFTPACNPKALCLEIETRALTAGHEPPRL